MSARSAAARLTAPSPTARTTADRAAAETAAAARPGTAARPQLRVVESVPLRVGTPRPAGDAAVRRGPFALVVAALLLCTTLTVLFLTIATGLDSVHATDLRAENAELAEDVQRLQQEVVRRGTPVELAAAATAAGLVPAGSAAYLVIAPDGSSTLRGTVTPAPEPPKPSRVPADKD